MQNCSDVIFVRGYVTACIYERFLKKNVALNVLITAAICVGPSYNKSSGTIIKSLDAVQVPISVLISSPEFHHVFQFIFKQIVSTHAIRVNV